MKYLLKQIVMALGGQIGCDGDEEMRGEDGRVGFGRVDQ